MASTGKKGKKSKGKTVSLTDFLSAGTSNEEGTKVVVAAHSSWADEMDEYDEAVHRGTEQILVLPTAPKAALGPAISEDRIPREPPFTAYIANLSYDINEQDVMKFFSKLQIKGVRLPREGDAETGRLKGFGYADFENRDSLIDALNMNDLLLKNRKVRVDLATHAGGREHGDRGGDRRGGGGGRYGDDGDDRTAGDWRSGPPPAARTDDRRPYERADDRRDNRGYGFDRRGGDDRGGFERRGGDDRGGFDRGGDRYERRGGDRFDRGGDRGGFERRDDDRGGRRGYDRRSPEREAPRERPKLVLAKRSEPADDHPQEQKDQPVKSSIFGGAKPVDTTKREKEIEEKLHSKPPPAHNPSHTSNSSTKSGSVHSDRGDEDDDHQRPAVDETAPPPPKPKAASIFGQAKPVDTTAREKEIEERLTRKTSEEHQPEPENGERKKLVLTRRSEPGKESQEIHSGQDSRRGAPRGGGGGYDDRRDRDYGGRGGGGDRDGGPRRDGPRRDIRDGGRGDGRGGYGSGSRREDRPPHQQHDRKRDHRSSPPPPRKFEEAPPPNFAVTNKFAFLQDSEEVGSGQDSE